MPRKVIIDTDPGIDDAVAIALALFDPNLDVLALTATAGNIPGELATRNIQVIVEQLDPPKWPRLACPATRETGWVPKRAENMHGSDGLGDADFTVAELRHLHPADKTIVDLVREYPHAVTLITLGPLTNVARAFERDPELPALVERVVSMGGSVRSGGNVTPAAEFNIWCDPESACEVFRANVPRTLIPLDVTRQVVFTLNHLDQLPDATTRVGRFVRRILPFSFGSHRRHRGMEGIYLHDAVAVGVVSHPTLVRCRPLALDVETRGELTRGMTVCDLRPHTSTRPNVEAAVEVAVDKVLNYVVQTLQTAGRVEAKP